MLVFSEFLRQIDYDGASFIERCFVVTPVIAGINFLFFFLGSV